MTVGKIRREYDTPIGGANGGTRYRLPLLGTPNDGDTIVYSDTEDAFVPVQGVQTNSFSVSGVGAVHDDINAMDFTGQTPVSGQAAAIPTASITTFVHNAAAYSWTGPTGVTVGVGGSYVAQAADLQGVGTADHAQLVNLTAANAHPQSAITDLVSDQNVQDGRLDMLETRADETDTEQATQDSRIGTNETDIANIKIEQTTQNNRLTTNEGDIATIKAEQIVQDSNIAANAAGIVTNAQNLVDHENHPDPHPQYQMKLPALMLYGSCANFTMSTAGSVLQTYTNSAFWNGADPTDVDPAAGTLTMPENGVYQVITTLTGQQGNDTKEESMFLDLAIDGVWRVVAVFDVATDKTDWRSFSAVATRALNAGQVLQLRGRATAGLGTFNVDAVTFEIHKLLGL